MEATEEEGEEEKRWNDGRRGKEGMQREHQRVRHRGDEFIYFI